MEATYSVRRPSFGAFAIVLALLGALILGAAGGYLVKSLAGQSSAVTAPAPAAAASTGSARGVQSERFVRDLAAPAQPASIVRLSGPRPGTIKAAGDDSGQAAPSVTSQANHRLSGLQE